MRALVLNGIQDWSIQEVPEPQARADEVILEVAGCGMCGTDLHTLTGGNKLVRFPAVPGHEFGGTVLSVGREVDWLRAGQRVVVDPSYSCGHCAQCQAGRGNLCPDKGGYGSRFPGGFAQRVAVRARSCVPVPDDLEWNVALLAEPLACVLHGVDRLGATVGRDAIVFGAGPIGLLTAILLRRQGSQVSIVESSDFRRAVVARHGFDAVARVPEELPEPSADVTVDATGVPAAIESAFAATRRGGSLLLMGVAHAGATVTLSPHLINWHELTIIGSMAVNNSFHRAVTLLGALATELIGFVTDTVPLDDFGQALDLVTSQRSLKVLVRP
ncbi:alcohol dehydrogenase catalytic domain-containing protein [Phytohabitans kaempferiae]|uniref:Alcohol dehydrogenase catalytic domain-containing protein n=1 Tax=Phytohabitans kaempferiae TaxID=1620943 RepID=A0ABV6MAJ0_9ACTN